MAELNQQAATPDFIPQDAAPPSNNPPPDFIPADPSQVPPAIEAPQQPADFIPADTSSAQTPAANPNPGGGWLSQIHDHFSKMTASDYQTIARNSVIEGIPLLAPFAKSIESNIETTPDGGVVSGKGAYQKVKSLATIPLAGTFHRKGAGPIEGETEDFITQQLNPVNIGLAVATAGSSAVESGLVKLGVSASNAAKYVKLAHLGANLGFLTKFGYDVGTKAIPKFEQDWADYNAEKNPTKKNQIFETMEREGTDFVLGSLATGLAARGFANDVHEVSSNSPKGQAMAQKDYANNIFEYQAENQVGSGQSHQLHREGMAAVPDAVRREAISNNIEANGDLNKLQEWADNTEDEKKVAGYEGAKTLTPKENALQDRLRSILDAWKARLREHSLLAPDGGRDNYVPHKPVFEDTDPTTGEQINRTGADGERDFLKKRIYPSHFEGEQAGVDYKTKDAVKLVADYVERANNMIARDNLAEGLAKGQMNEGSPMAVSGGYLGVPRDVELTPTEAMLLKQRGQLDALLKKGRVYEVKGPEADQIRAKQQAQANPPAPTGTPNSPTPAGNSPAPALQNVPKQLPAPEFIPHTPEAWEQPVQPTTKVNGSWTEAPSTPKIIFAAEQALKDRGFPPENIGRLRKMTMDIPEVGAGPRHAEMYARLLQDAIRTHDATVNASPEDTTDRLIKHGLLPRGEFPEGYHDAQDSTTGGSVNVKKGAGDTTIARKVADHRAAIGDIANLSDVGQAKAKGAQERYQQQYGIQTPIPPAEPRLVGMTNPKYPVYKWKFDDYVDSGLRANRPLANQPAGPGSAIVPHPDMNSYPGEAIMSQGQGGIPTDPKTGKNMTRVPVFVNPEIAAHLRAVMDSSAPKSALMRAALKISGGAKSVLLSLSPFHWVTEGIRAGEAGVNPSKAFKNAVTMPTPVDYYNLTDKQTQAINDGVVVGNTRPGHSDYTAEGNAPGHESFASKIPIIGGVNHWLESRLFGPQGFITGLKFDLYDQLKPKIMQSNPGMSESAAGRIAASQVNNKFGGLNYTVLGRSASTQNAMRMALLAPDFLESTGRSMADVAGKYGTTMMKSLVAFQLAHYVTARAMNYLVNGNFHPESGFSVQSKDGKHEYGIRTTLGDFLHFANAPRDFMMNRVNPLLVRTPMELIGGVDQQGHKVSDTQKIMDTAKQFLPIPFQGLATAAGILPNQQITQPSAADEALKSVGIQARKRFTPAESLAYNRATTKNQGQPLEGDALEKAQTKFRLADALRDAVSNKDAEGASKATHAILESAKGDKPMMSWSDAQSMIQDAHVYKNRLESTVRRLPLADSLDVYDIASASEKAQLRTQINQKISSFYKSVEQGKKASGEYRALQPRIQKFFSEKQ